MPQQILKQLRINIPQGKRSQFIASAVEEKLTMKKSTEETLKKSLKANSAFYKTAFKEWEATLSDGLEK